ncbi:MAG: PAS domain S-box protein [Bacillota bacterium]
MLEELIERNKQKLTSTKLQNELLKTKARYLENEHVFNSLFDNNHIVMLLIEPETGEIIEANSKACKFYGFSKEEIKRKKITDFNIMEKELVFKEMENARKEERNYFLFQHQATGGEIRDVEVFSGPIRIKGKQLLYSIVIDITERVEAQKKALEYSMLLEGVLRGVPDIIGVHTPNHTNIFYNRAGYEFFKTDHEQAKGKKCFQMLGRNKHCDVCGVIRARQSKKMEIIEKYIPEIDRHMDCRYNPILDEKGEVVLIIEQLRDITEQKKAAEALMRSEERYRNLFDLSPDGTGVLSEGNIIIVNNKLTNLLGAKDSKEIIGQSIFDFIHKDHRQAAAERIKRVTTHGATNALKDFKFIRLDGKTIDVEVASAPFSYQGNPAVQFVVRDITERKRQMERAALIQKQRLDTKFPLVDKAELEIIYAPADEISGDLFQFYKPNEHTVVGILFDISGKGISAALSSSALRVLFYDIASETSDSMEIVNKLNKEITKYLGEEYVAACCFSFDFNKMEVKIAGAGINTFIHHHKGYYCMEQIVKGPFLGMLDVNLFDHKELSLERGDKFYFYTDGLEGILSNREILEQFSQMETLYMQKEFIRGILYSKGELEDDSTLLAIEIK